MLRAVELEELEMAESGGEFGMKLK